MGNIVVLVGINKITTMRDLTWENVIDSVRRYEPITATEINVKVVLQQ